MRHLNYNHLLYFWTVAREGSIARASEVLHLTPQTISGQLKLLEASVGEPLFHRVGRGLALTDTGKIVNQYAEEIFTLGAELTQRVRSRQPGLPPTLTVGIVDSIPKLIAYRVLGPGLELEETIRLVCLEGNLDKLLADMALHRLDLVLSDRGIPPGVKIKAYNHALGESSVTLFAHKTIAGNYRKDFPGSLNGAPMLLPVHANPLRRGLQDWFDRVGVSPRIVAEFDDSALLRVFGEAGRGIFPAPSAIASEVSGRYNTRSIGEIGDVTDQYFAISPDRKLKHPVVRAIIENARSRLFS
ncbi:MAG: transcriptional activator NhaR [Arenicellales bacterium]